MPNPKTQRIVKRIVSILEPYMSAEEALERANNLAQVYVLDREGFTEEIECMIIPNSAKAGIENEEVRKTVVEQLLKIN